MEGVPTKILGRATLTYYENEIFSDSSLHHILESENFRFPFFLRKIAAKS